MKRGSVRPYQWHSKGAEKGEGSRFARIDSPPLFPDAPDYLVTPRVRGRLADLEVMAAQIPYAVAVGAKSKSANGRARWHGWQTWQTYFWSRKSFMWE